MEKVILVDPEDNQIGTLGKLEAHQPPGNRHRAVSLFLQNRQGKLLLQRRALEKYHFPGVWANACCTHPGPEEDVAATVERRAMEELGLTCTPIEIGTFEYRAEDPVSGLVEHEIDHVFTATISQDPAPDPSEVMDWRWTYPGDLIARIDAGDSSLAPWVSAAVRALPGILGETS